MAVCLWECSTTCLPPPTCCFSTPAPNTLPPLSWSICPTCSQAATDLVLHPVLQCTLQSSPPWYPLDAQQGRQHRVSNKLNPWSLHLQVLGHPSQRREFVAHTWHVHPSGDCSPGTTAWCMGITHGVSSSGTGLHMWEEEMAITEGFIIYR